MYSTDIPEISDKPVQFGTSGLLYRSNKLMYDRVTNTLWRQFTGEPVVGELAHSGIELETFPVVTTTWGEWLAAHPDTTVLSPDTGWYEPETYYPEPDPRSIYYFYFASPGTMFPVWRQSDALPAKAPVLGLLVGGIARGLPAGGPRRGARGQRLDWGDRPRGHHRAGPGRPPGLCPGRRDLRRRARRGARGEHRLRYRGPALGWSRRRP